LAANKKTIVVITSGGAVDMTAWIDHTPALLESWYPGQEAGTALADILFGEVNPSGKLPVTFDRNLEDSAVAHNYYADPREQEGEVLRGGIYRVSPIRQSQPTGISIRLRTRTQLSASNLSVTPQSADLSSPVVVTST
jgi:beta-glucosidase